MAQTSRIYDRDALLVVRFLLVRANTWVLLELSAHLFDDFFGCDTHSVDCPRAENEDSHGAKKASHKDFRDSNIDDLELLACHHLHLVQVGREEKEAGE